MKKLALISLMAASLAVVTTPALARDKDDYRRFDAHYSYDRRDYRDSRYDRDYDRHHDHHYDRHDNRYDKHRDWRHDRSYRRDAPKYYRCDYHPGNRGHNHHHYYDSRTGEYLAIIGGTILLTQLLHSHH